MMILIVKTLLIPIMCIFVIENMVLGYLKHSFVQDDSFPDVKLLLAGLYFITVTCLLVSSADNICKQFGPKSGLTKCRA